MLNYQDMFCPGCDRIPAGRAPHAPPTGVGRLWPTAAAAAWATGRPLNPGRVHQCAQPGGSAAHVVTFQHISAAATGAGMPAGVNARRPPHTFQERARSWPLSRPAARPARRAVQSRRPARPAGTGRRRRNAVGHAHAQVTRYFGPPEAPHPTVLFIEARRRETGTAGRQSAKTGSSVRRRRRCAPAAPTLSGPTRAPTLPSP